MSFAVKADTLLDMIEYMTSKVGLVHQMPFTCDREGFAATFEKVRTFPKRLVLCVSFHLMSSIGDATAVIEPFR